MNKENQQLLFDFNEKEEVKDLEEKEVEELEEPIDPNQVFYNSDFELDKKSEISGSPVFSDQDIPLNSYRVFEPICSWSKTNIVKDNLFELDFICPIIFRKWAENFLIHPLLEPEYSTWIMSAEGESLLTIFSQFSESQIDSFSEFYSNHITHQDLEGFWSGEMLRIGVELLTRLGILRMGKARLSYAPRIWVGRRSEALSPQIRFQGFGHDPETIANGFVNTFVGENSKNCDWELGYRAALWRLVISEPGDKRVIYIEEHEEEDY